MKITDLRVCPSYIGVACIDGSCPKANKEEYEEYCIPVVYSCEECHFYLGCADCAEYGCDNELKSIFENK